MTSFKMVTYNIRRGKNVENCKGLEDTFQTLQKINADIIALQEVEMMPGVGNQSRQAQILARKLGMQFVYGAVHRLKFGSVGNAVLARYNLINDINHILPDSREPRGCLQVDINVNGSIIRLFNTHLGLSQISRFRHLKYIILPMMQTSSFPCILAGDMNAAPRMREMQMLSYYLHDTFLHNSGMIGHTYPSDYPRARIDYIFLDERSKCEGLSIIKSNASDHLPVTACISIIPN